MSMDLSTASPALPHAGMPAWSHPFLSKLENNKHHSLHNLTTSTDLNRLAGTNTEIHRVCQISIFVLCLTHPHPEGMPLWGPNRFWPGSGLVLRCLGPGFTVLALGPGFRPIIIIITHP